MLYVFSNDTAVADPPSRDGMMQDWLPGGCPVTTEMGLQNCGCLDPTQLERADRLGCLAIAEQLGLY